MGSSFAVAWLTPACDSPRNFVFTLSLLSRKHSLANDFLFKKILQYKLRTAILMATQAFMFNIG